MKKMTLTKTMAILLVLLLLPLSIIGCTAKEDKESSGEGIIGTEDGAGTEESVGLTSNYTNPMLEEIEDILFNQLQPMPDLNQGEKIGALVITLTNPFWVDMKNGYEQAARELGVNLEVMAAPTENDAKSQLETLDAMVAKDFKALIISPIEPFNLVPGVVRANERGIPVINLGPHIDIDAVREAGGTIDGRILVDFEEQGELAAQYIVDKLDANGGEVAIIQGIPGAGQSEGRTAGARKVFDRSENVKVVSVQPANWDRNQAYNIASNLIQAHPNLKAIFSCNDVMALAAVDALEAAGKRDGMIVFGVDFISEAHEAIKEGRLDGSIAYSMRVYSKAAVIQALKLIQGHDLPEQVQSPLVAATKENIHEFEGWE